MKSQAMEIVTFKLSKGIAFKEFIEVNLEIDDWLLNQKGFKSRHIGIQEDGLVTDLLIWDSVNSGQNAMKKMMKKFSDSAVHSMIDQRTVIWKIIPVSHFIFKN